MTFPTIKINEKTVITSGLNLKIGYASQAHCKLRIEHAPSGSADVFHSATAQRQSWIVVVD